MFYEILILLIILIGILWFVFKDSYFRRLTELPPNYYIRVGRKNEKGQYTNPKEFSYRNFYTELIKEKYYRRPIIGTVRRWRLIVTLLLIKKLVDR